MPLTDAIALVKRRAEEDREDNRTAMRPFYDELFTEAKEIRLVSVNRAA